MKPTHLLWWCLLLIYYLTFKIPLVFDFFASHQSEHSSSDLRHTLLTIGAIVLMVRNFEFPNPQLVVLEGKKEFLQVAS